MGYTTKASYPSAYNLGAFMAGNVPIVAGQYVELGRVTMGAQAGVQVGAGTSAGQDSANGRMFAVLKDSTASPGVAVAGYVRMDVHDSNDTPIATIFEKRTEDLNTSTSDRRQMYPLPTTGNVIGPNYALVLKFKADAGAVGNGNVGLANSSALFDVTKYTLALS